MIWSRLDGASNLTLLYPFDSAPSFHVIGTPVVLHFSAGPATIAPVNGPVV